MAVVGHLCAQSEIPSGESLAVPCWAHPPPGVCAYDQAGPLQPGAWWTLTWGCHAGAAEADVGLEVIVTLCVCKGWG